MKTRERVVLLFYTFFNIISNQYIKLYSDEAYYWVWSKKLDFSYFDHPPMVAYLIKLTTLFSDEPIFLRLSAALLVSFTAYLLYALAKRIFDEKSAVYTFYIFISSVFIIAASTIIAPDIPMMFFWTLTLYSAYRYIEEDNKKFALLLGISGGALLLSKYPGVLVLFTILVYIIIYRRDLFKDKYLYIAMALVPVVFSPVLYWNYIYDFISFTFQINHGVAKEKIFLPKEFFSFVGVQFALFHPFYLLPLFYFIFKDRERFSRKKVFLLLPFLFVFVFFSYHAAFKHANAQWAAGAYVSASILLGHYMVVYNARKLLIAGLSLSALLIVLIKTPIGPYTLKPVENLLSRLGRIDNFSPEIQALDLDIESYDYILIDDYHGCEVAYYFRKHNNLLVLNNARFSSFNIWRQDEAGIDMMSPLKSIPKLGKCIYIGKSLAHANEIASLFGNQKVLAHKKKKAGKRNLEYYFVEYTN